ncbi:MAG: glycoside hydrolase family 3 C-terminal domain-containing protein [Acidobacteriota bacterium]|nr:glycoside hydrolase family 3 C-terminal domain-containing protein [Acidobacteriota bacterium]
MRPFSAVSFLEGIANGLGTSVRTLYDRGIPSLGELAAKTNFSIQSSGGEPGMQADYFAGGELTGDPVMRRVELHIDFGETAGADIGYAGPAYPAGAESARWSGYYSAANAGAYDFFVQSTGEAGGYYRVYVDGNPVLDNWTQARALVGYATLSLDAGPHKIQVEHRGRPGFLGMRFRFGIVPQSEYVNSAAEKLAAEADAVLLAVGFDPQSESEGSDRTFRLPPGEDQLIEKIASINPRTIVVITSGGSVDMSGWIDRVPAILEAWDAGQEGGTALARILFGEADPSGRLPITFERRWEDNPVHEDYYPEPGSNRVAYKEGVFIGYRGYERSGVKPLFPFGYGLSYTRFRYGNLKIQPIESPHRSGESASTGIQYDVSWTVTNIGPRSGADVAEVYVGEAHPRVPRPARELKGFARANLRSGETRRLHAVLNSRAFAYFDETAHQWRVDAGEFNVYVGNSVDELPLKATVSLTKAQAAAGASRP